jgi:hypothetical protein
VQLHKNYQIFYGTRRFITVFTRALHQFLFSTRSIQFIPPHPSSQSSILISSRVYGCVTNNNRIWSGWSDVLTPSFTIALLIKINYNNSQAIFSRTLLPWLPRTRSILVLVLRMTSDLRLDYLYCLKADPQKTQQLPSNIYAKHTENTSTIIVFTARCMATEVIRLLHVYSLSRECVYRVVAQQRVYISQYYRPTYILVFLVVFYLLAFPPLSYIQLFCYPFVLHILPISFLLDHSNYSDYFPDSNKRLIFVVET